MTRASTEHGVTETFTGKFVNAFDLRLEDICIEDVAHHLAMECRFAGACNRRYSVAEHSILVRRFIAQEYKSSEAIQFAGLMHDAFETYGKDIPTPQKSKVYKLAEAKGMKVISEVLGFEYPNPIVETADTILRWLEGDAFLPSRGRTWSGYDTYGRDVIERYGRSSHAERLRQGPGQEDVIEAFFLRDFEVLAPLDAIGRKGSGVCDGARE